MKYGYVGAGQKDVFRDAIEGLSPGDVIAAYLNGRGYVGVGKITGKGQPAKEFCIHGGNLLIDQPGVAPRIKDNLHDLDNCEWMAPVQWIGAVDRKDAYFKRKAGLFTPRAVRASLGQQPKTIKFIEESFTIPDLFALTDAELSQKAAATGTTTAITN